jgi:hypothetical protein
MDAGPINLKSAKLKTLLVAGRLFLLVLRRVLQLPQLFVLVDSCHHCAQMVKEPTLITKTTRL